MAVGGVVGLAVGVVRARRCTTGPGGPTPGGATDRRRRCAPRIALLVGVLSTLLVAGPLAADPRELYKQGLEALGAERWVDAERFFRAAIAERSEERYNALLGRRYFPHFQLGIALAEQGDCTAALDAWQTSKGQGKINRDGQLSAELGRRSQGCRDRLARVGRLAAEVDELLAQTDDGFATLAGLAAKPALASSWNAQSGLGERQERLRQSIDQGRQQVTAARRRQDAERLETLRDQASSIASTLQQLIADARAALGEVNAATTSALGSLEGETSRARSLLRSVSRLAPYPPALASRVGAVQQLVGEAERLGETARPRQMSELEGRLKTAYRALRRASAAPPDALIVALEAHLAGDPRGVLESLDSAEPFDDPRARAHACLLRAAALHLRHVGESVRPVVEEPDDIGESPSDTPPSDDDPRAEPVAATETETEGGAEGAHSESTDTDSPAEDMIADSGVGDESLPVGEELAGERVEPEPPVNEEDIVRTLRICVALESPVEPSRRYFSPRFIALYQDLRAEAAGAEDQDNPISE